MIKRLLSLLALLVFIGMGGWACATSRAGYKEAVHRVLRRDGQVELRAYEAMQWVQVGMPTEAQRREGMNGGFMQLFGYISGKNEGSRKIAMTTPVFMEDDPKQKVRSFVLPADLANAPAPKTAGVQLRQLPAMPVAALRFSGVSNPQIEAQKLEELRQWLKTQNLKPADAPALLAYYDPPWTPGPMRRNEVLLRLSAMPPETPAAAKP